MYTNNYQDDNNSSNGYGNNNRNGGYNGGGSGGSNYGSSNLAEDELFTWIVKAGPNRVYYLNVKESSSGELYLIVKENKRNPDGSKQSHRIMIFNQDLEKFAEGITKVMDFIKTQEGDSTGSQQDHNSADTEELPSQDESES